MKFKSNCIVSGCDRKGQLHGYIFEDLPIRYCKSHKYVLDQVLKTKNRRGRGIKWKT